MVSRLKTVLRERHLQTHSAFCREYDKIAATVDPDLVGSGPKRAQFHRWLSGEVKGLPYPHHCRVLEKMLPGHTATELFGPDTTVQHESYARNFAQTGIAAPEQCVEVTGTGVIEVYPYRSSIPNGLWARLLADTKAQLDILVLAGLFLAEDPVFTRTVRQRTQEGLAVRLMFGDPREPDAAKRSAEERLAPATVPARIRNALALVRPLVEVPNVDARYHRTTLYNSIFRFDDEMIVNMHVYGQPGAHAPAMHLRRLPAGGLFDTYMTSFEQVWDESEPADFEDLR